MAIIFKDVALSYDSKRKKTTYALKDINLHISSEDEFITIVGRTGSGKSSLVSMFNALKYPSSGDAFIYGIKVAEKHPRRVKYNPIRKRIGLCFQFPDYQLFEETVLKDVMFGPMNFGLKENEAREEAINALHLVGLSEDLYLKSPFELSGGEKKMVSIAGILSSNPDILILDEPTAGLDPYLRRELLKLLNKLNKEYHKSIIIITHDMNMAYEYSKRTIVLKEGHIIYDGQTKELFISHKVILNEASLMLPDVVRITDELNAKCGLNLDYKDNIDDIYKELVNE